jgi:hypothetical protein
MKISQAQWASIRQEFIDRTADRGVHLVLRDRVWAVTHNAEWVALPGTSDSPNADRWWLGCDPDKLRERQPLGIVLLCKAREGSLYAIGLPNALFRELEPKLSKPKSERQVFFNVVRRGTRFLLQLKGGEEFDVTAHLDDVSWITNGNEHRMSSGRPSYGASRVAEGAVTETAERSARDQMPPPAAAIRFFAVVKKGSLHPLDDVGLESGSVYLVELRDAPSIPGNRALRRILARGGPGDLPADLAEQHDHYAHGAGRR